MGSNGTQFEFVGGGKGAAGGEVLLVPLTVKPQPPMQMLTHVDAICDEAVSELVAVGAVGADAGKLAHTTRSGKFRRIVVVSLGDAKDLDARGVRTAGASAARWLVTERVKQATLWVDGLAASGVDRATAQWAGAMVVEGFCFSEHKSADGAAIAKARVAVRSSESGHISRTLPQIKEEVAIANGVNYTRLLGHRPPNVINPATLAAEAKRLARSAKLKCTVLESAQLKKAGMNGLLAVGQGADPGPCLIQLEYHGAPRAKTTTVLVGKAITFDTGGYSIKTTGMESMKYDKCGGTTVLGVMKAAADLKLKCNLIGVIAAAENAISDRAYRPGDIIKMMSGKTVEVTNTDAEGRLVLADALWHAQKKCKPTTLIDLATLTGGVNVALGRVAAGLMSNDDTLAAELEECGRATHERLWRLPLWDEYRELIRGSDSDIKNSAGKRDAAAIVGGMFLKEFIEKDTPWAHLDIAAVATQENGNGRSATGFGVRLLVEFLRRRG